MTNTIDAMKKDKEVTVIVNGTPKKWDKNKISFKEIVVLTYGSYNENSDTTYTIMYENQGGQDKSVTPGEEVKVFDGIEFDVVKTHKS